MTRILKKSIRHLSDDYILILDHDTKELKYKSLYEDHPEIIIKKLENYDFLINQDPKDLQEAMFKREAAFAHEKKGEINEHYSKQKRFIYQ